MMTLMVVEVLCACVSASESMWEWAQRTTLVFSPHLPHCLEQVSWCLLAAYARLADPQKHISSPLRSTGVTDVCATPPSSMWVLGISLQVLHLCGMHFTH